MGSKYWKALAILLLGVLALGVFFWWDARPRLTDKEQISLVINELESGIEKKRPREVLDHISSKYTDSSGLNHAKLSALAGRLFREPWRVEIEILDYEGPNIDGDSARMTLLLSATAISWRSRPAEVQGNVELQFAKERKGWKVLKSEGWQQWMLEYAE